MWCACSGDSVPPQSRRPFLRSCCKPQLRGGWLLYVSTMFGNLVQSNRPVSVMLPAERVAVAADVLGQRIDDETRVHVPWLEKPGRGHRVVDDVKDAARAAQSADPGEVGDLHPRIGDRLDENDARRRCQRRFHVCHVGGIDHRQAVPVGFERREQAVGVAKHELARHDVVAGLEQRQHDGADGGHARRESHRPHTAFHGRDLRFERGRRRVALPAVGIPLRPSLEDGGELVRILVAVGNGHVQWLVQRAVLDRRVAIRMQNGGGETARGFVLAHDRFRPDRNNTKDPSGSPPNGSRTSCASNSRPDRTSL